MYAVAGLIDNLSLDKRVHYKARFLPIASDCRSHDVQQERTIGEAIGNLPGHRDIRRNPTSSIIALNSVPLAEHLRKGTALMFEAVEGGGDETSLESRVASVAPVGSVLGKQPR